MNKERSNDYVDVDAPGTADNDSKVNKERSNDYVDADAKE